MSTAGAEARPDFRPDVQGLRGVAVLLVVIFHVGLLPAGFVGVDVFFVISGFVVIRSLLRSMEREGGSAAQRLGDFYRRRIARLLPAFASLIAPVVLAGLIVGPIGSVGLSLRTAVSGLLLSSNLILYRSDSGYFALGSEGNSFLHLWSLSVEEQFYLSIPLILGGLAATALRRRLRASAFWAILGVSVLSFVASVAFTFRIGPLPGGISAPATFAFYAPVTRAWEFGVGALIAIGEGRVRALPGAALVAALSLLALAASLLIIDGEAPFPGLVAALPVLGAAGVIFAGTQNRAARPLMPLGWRPLVWMGDVSYSWYLWHWPLIIFAGAVFPSRPWALPLAGAASLLPAWFSYRQIEQRLRIRRGDEPAVQRAKLRGSLGIGVGALALSAGLLFWIPTSGHPFAEWSRQTRKHIDVERGCDRSVALAQSDRRCSWIPEAPPPVGPIYLIGDSNAGQLSEAVIGAGEALGRSVIIRTHSSCALTLGDASEPDEGRGAGPCRRFSIETLEVLRTLAPTDIVIGSSFEYFHADGSADLPARGTLEAQSARDGFTRFLSALQALGHRVVLVEEVPKLPEWPLPMCPVHRAFRLEGALCRYDIPLARSATPVDENRAFMSTLDSGGSRLRTLDLAGAICPDGVCSARGPEGLIYRDAGHLSIATSVRLAPSFTEVLARPGG